MFSMGQNNVLLETSATRDSVSTVITLYHSSYGPSSDITSNRNFSCCLPFPLVQTASSSDVYKALIFITGKVLWYI